MYRLISRVRTVPSLSYLGTSEPTPKKNLFHVPTLRGEQFNLHLLNNTLVGPHRRWMKNTHAHIQTHTDTRRQTIQAELMVGWGGDPARPPEWRLIKRHEKSETAASRDPPLLLSSSAFPNSTYTYEMFPRWEKTQLDIIWLQHSGFA